MIWGRGVFFGFQKGYIYDRKSVYVCACECGRDWGEGRDGGRGMRGGVNLKGLDTQDFPFFSLHIKRDMYWSL